nr:HIRAN domain-containing protein [Pectobacterium aquaticum]
MEITVIDVSLWREDDEHAIFPYGARDKMMLWSPSDPPEGIKANWPYLFKQSREAYPEQFWGETIAYIVGEAMHVNVPPAYPAFKKSEEVGIEHGALIEWFYDVSSQVFVHASEFFFSLIKDFDKDSGCHHNFVDLVRICRRFSLNGVFDKTHLSWANWLMGMIIFDALIGNTDRHQENWGFIFEPTKSEDGPKGIGHLAPLFDNGTSLGCEMLPGKVQGWTPQRLDKYIDGGRHHLRHHRTDTKTRIGHIESLKLFYSDEKLTRWMRYHLTFDLPKLQDDIQKLSSIPLGVPLSNERVAWVCRLINRRYQRLTLVLEMRTIQKIIEPRRLWLTWQPLSGGTRYLVGQIDREGEDSFTLNYHFGTAEFNYAREKGFAGYPAFSLKEQFHTGNVLDPFLRRLPPRTRKDFNLYLKKHLLPVPFEGSDFSLLAYTGAKSPADGFSVIPDLSSAKNGEYIAEVAGTRYQKTDLSTVSVGDSVKLSPEPGNEVDSNAVQVIHANGCLGYVNKVHCLHVLSKIKKQKVSAFVARKNGTPERPLIYLFLEFDE